MATHNAEGSINAVHSLAAGANLIAAASGDMSGVTTMDGSIVAAPRVSLAEAIDSVRVRVTFDQPMARDSSLLDPANYAIASIGDGVPVFVSSLLSGPGAAPTFVELDVNEMTGGESYSATVQSGAGAPQSQFAIGLNPLGAQFGFTGEGVNPTVTSVAGVGLNRVDIAFSEVMLDNAAIRDPANYVFDGGLLVLGVLDVVGDVVQLVTSDQVPGQLYNLTIG